jgi:hypothetical protein
MFTTSLRRLFIVISGMFAVAFAGVAPAYATNNWGDDERVVDGIPF